MVEDVAVGGYDESDERVGAGEAGGGGGFDAAVAGEVAEAGAERGAGGGDPGWGG